MRRHELDLVSLLAGIALCGAGGLLVGDRVDLLVRVRWGWPIALIAVALVMLVSAATAGPRPEDPAPPASLGDDGPATSNAGR